MARGTLLGAAAVVVAVAVGCKARPAVAPAATPAPSPATARRLVAEDLKILVAVKGKALRQLEEALGQTSGEGGEALGRLKDLVTSEREAAAALGVDWERYNWVKEEIARVLARQRQGEDARVLALELERSRDDLRNQLERTRDAASRQFLEAQIESLDRQLAAIAEERVLDPEVAASLQLIEGVRAELAELQGRQDLLQKRIRELVRQERGSGAPALRRLRSGDGGQPGRVGQEKRQ